MIKTKQTHRQLKSAIDPSRPKPLRKIEEFLSPIKSIPLSRLRPNPLNPHKVREDADYEMTRTSVEKVGFIEPIIVKKDGTLISGHKRLSIAKDLGYESIQGRYYTKPINDILEEKDLIMTWNIFRREYKFIKKVEYFLNMMNKEEKEAIKHLPNFNESKKALTPSKASYILTRLNVLKENENVGDFLNNRGSSARFNFQELLNKHFGAPVSLNPIKRARELENSILKKEDTTRRNQKKLRSLQLVINRDKTIIKGYKKELETLKSVKKTNKGKEINV